MHGVLQLKKTNAIEQHNKHSVIPQKPSYSELYNSAQTVLY